MSAPYTREDLNNMSDETLIELMKTKSRRLYPYCLIGENFDIAKVKAKEWSKSIQLINTKYDAFIMEHHIEYFAAEIDENNIITDLNLYFV